MLDKEDKKFIENLLDNKLDGGLKGQRQEFERFTGAMFESLEEQIKILAESVAGIMAQLQEMNEEMRVMRSDLKYKADREEMILLERRVLKLERLAAR